MIDDYNFTVNVSHDDPTSRPLKKIRHNAMQSYKFHSTFHFSLAP